jgi:hypothetical protein
MNRTRELSTRKRERLAVVTSWLLVILLTGEPIALAASDYFGQVTFNGLPVPGASVIAAQGATTVSATTNQDGIYHLPDLADGPWNLTIEMRGFTTITREIRIPAAESEPPAASLAARSLDEITREAPAVESAAPGAFPRTSLVQTAAPAADGSGTATLFRAPVDLSVLIGPTGIGAEDGLLINGSLNNGAATPFALPRGIGNNRPRPPSVFSYVTSLQLGNSAWDARPFSVTGSRPAKPSYTDVQGQGSMQGQFRVPWLRNALNVAAGYQGETATTANMLSTRIPTDIERLGDFSQTLDVFGQPVRVVDPATLQPFARGVIPADRLSPQAAALLGYYPRADPNATGRFNYQAPVLTATRTNAVRSRLAYTMFSQHQISGGVSYQRTATDTTSLFGFEDSRRASTLDAQAAVMLRPSRYMTVNARYQYTRAKAELVPYFANRVDVSGAAGITGNDSDPRNWGPPSLTFASDLAGLTDGRYSSTIEQTHVWAADVSRFRGTHNVSFGGEMRKRLNDVFAQQDPRGSFSFTGAASGVDFADFLLGLPQTSAIAFGNADKYFRGDSYAAYVTDDWRVRPSFTLTFGLRWEYETPVREARGRLVNLDVAPGFTAVGPVLAGETGSVTGTPYSNALIGTDKSGFLPRVGVAWRPRLGSSIVVRGGYGLYRNTNVYQSIASLLAVQPPLSTSFNIATSPSQPLTLGNGFDAVGGTVLNTFAVDPNFRVSSAHTWDVSLQRDLPWALTVLASYTGVRGTNLMQQLLPNTYPAGAGNPCPTCPAGFRYLVSNGRSTRHAGSIQARHRLSGGFTGSFQYTLAKALDNAAAFSGASLDGAALAQNWLDLEAEYARSNFDQRHLVAASVEYTTGSGIRSGTLVDGWRGRLLKDWTFTANLITGSGLPLTPVFFAPVAGTGVIGALRPDLTGIAKEPSSGAYANAAAFRPPAPGQWGNAPRNSITGPATFTLNAGVARTFRMNTRVTVDWRIDATNVMNRVTYGGVVTSITSPQFGLPNRVNDMRKLRSSIRVRF